MGVERVNKYINKQGLMSLAQGHNTVLAVKLEPTDPRAKHSTTVLPWLCSCQHIDLDHILGDYLRTLENLPGEVPFRNLEWVS